MANAASATTADNTVTIHLEGCLTAYTVGPIWRSALDILRKNPSRPVVVNADKLESVDNTGIALLFDLRRRPRPADAAVTIRNLAPNIEVLVGSFDPKDFLESSEAVTSPGLIEAIGRAAAEEAADARTLIAFLGETTAGLFAALSRLRLIHWHDVLTLAQEAGANAVAIVLLIGFLMGVIIAFEIGLVAQQFGAVIFVVNGVGIAMLRELGPLMTAILFAGRSGAAFAAEIGTQKVNEEINALTTFGIDPVQFLVVPRLIASFLMVPLLSVLADVIGLFGGALVMLSFNITFVQFYHQLLGAVGISDLVIGLIKAGVFGLLIAGIGCQRGLSTRLGAASVGLSATSAVVTSIVLIVVTDGLFAVLINRLGL